MRIKRRDFLKRSALGVGGVLAGARFATADEPTGLKFDPYGPITLGQSKIKMSRLCLGTGVHGGNRASNQTRMGKEKFEALIKGSYERGVRVFDLADLYGTHPYLVPALKGIPRDDYVIITKIWWNTGGIPEKERPDADVVIPRFLKEIGTDYLDLVLLHCVTSPKWPDELSKQMSILSDFKKKGAIRAHGVSCHTLAALQLAAATPWVDVDQARVNPDGILMDADPATVIALLRQMKASGKGIIGMKILGEGQLGNDLDRAIAHAVGLDAIDAFTIGFVSTTQMDEVVQKIATV